MVIDEAMKSTEEEFGIIIRAIQDDMTLLGDAKVIFGTNGDNGALEFLLSALEEVGLVPNRSKFKIFAVDDDEETLGFIPDWLRTPDTRPQVETEGGGVAYGMELLGAPIGHVCFENEWLAKAATKIIGKIDMVTNAIGSLCPHSAHAVTHYSSQALGDFICATSRSCQTRHFARTLDAALRAAYKFIYHVDFLDPDGHERNAKDSAFVRDWFCLRTSQSGGGFRPYLQRFNFLNAINNVLPQMIDRTDFNSNSTIQGFWTCLTDRIGAGSFDTPEKGASAKHRWELFFARQDSPIAREIMSEIGRAKDSFLEALEGAEVDPASDMVQKSFLSVSDTDFGLGFGKLQHAISDELLKYRAKALGIRARKLPLDDQRRMAFLNREDCPFASQFLSGCPLPSVRFTPTLFRLAIQHIFGVPLTALAHIVGSKIHNNPKMPQRNVDAHGNNLTAITGSTGDHSRSLHDYMLQFVATELERIGAKYLAAKKGYKSTAGIFTHVLQPLLGTATADKAFKLINGILPDFAIDARGARFSELLQFTDSSRLDGVETLVDIKGLGIGESSDYVSFRAEQGQLKPIDRRAVKVHKEYCKAAKDLDSKYHHTPDGEIGPVKSALLSFGPVAGKYEGTVLGLGIGCFGELSAGFNDVCTFIARNRAVSYVDRYDDKSPKEALGMFRSRIRRVWGHAAIFAWSDLILDRSRKLVGLQSPAACATRAGGDSDPNFENYDLFHAQSPDTGRGVHARSWRANRDVDVRR